MNFLVGYFVGIWNAFRRIKMWGLLYGITLLFAVMLALPFFNILDGAIGDSLEVEKLLSGYNHMIIDDFLHTHGKLLGVVFGQLQSFAVFFLLLFIFLTGGILRTYDLLSEKFSFQRFWSGCTAYFWRIFRIFLLFLIIQAIVAFVVYYPLSKYFDMGFAAVQDERSFYNAGLIALSIHAVLATIVAMISDYTKVSLVKENKYSVVKQGWKSAKFVFRHFLKTYPLYLLNLLTFLALVSIYVFVGKRIGMISKTTIVVMFCIQQLFIFLRLGTKLMNLASISAMYDAVVLKKRKEGKPLEIDALASTNKNTNNEIAETQDNDHSSTISAYGPMEILNIEEAPNFDEENQDYNEREFMDNLDDFNDDLINE